MDPDLAIRPPGPWTHRDVSANGSRFHVAEMGEGPAVVLLHGFPTFWWTWRDTMVQLAQSGYHVIAMDLRGYAGSDHPPEGYDPITLAADVAGVITGLGVDQATIIGHGWGGLIGWTMCTTQSEMVRTLINVSAPHPHRIRSALLGSRRQRAAMGYIWGLQVPIAPERKLMRDDGRMVTNLMRGWSADASWLTPDASSRYQAAFTYWPTAHTAIEYHRWAMRSVFRTDGRRFMETVQPPIPHDVLSIRGQFDPMVLETSFEGEEEFVLGRYECASVPAGHFVYEEAPEVFLALITDWMTKEPTNGRMHNDEQALDETS